MVAPIETAGAISRALREVIEAAFGGDSYSGPDTILDAEKKLEGRAALHLRALAELWKRLGSSLPEDIRIAIHVLDSDASVRIEDVRVIVVLNHRKLTLLQRRLINMLAPDADDPRAHDLQLLVQRLNQPACSSPGSALSHVSAHLFAEGKSDAVGLDETVQILAVRDAREEAEVAASMVQDILHAEPGLSPADIGILVPLDEAYGDAVRDAFTYAGLALSGISTGERLRDLGREYVRHFLSCRQRLAPVMALAAFVTSPLAPWPETTGRAMASMVMNGDFDLDRAEGAGNAGKEILSLLRTEDESASGLASALNALGRNIWSDESLEAAAAAAREAIRLRKKRFMIVDYKKSGSRRRRLRMQAGFDIQLPLYRLMATTGTIEGLTEDANTAVRDGAGVGIVYFMMDDGRALTDAVVDLDVSHPRWRPIEADISAVAMPVVRRRLASLRKGSIERDTNSWLTQIEKNGSVGLYALEVSPIIPRFVVDDSFQSGGDDDGGA